MGYGSRLSRRALVAAGLALPAGFARGAPAAPPTRDVAFQIWRGGGQIGEHSVSFKTDGAETVATIAASFVVKIGPVPVFRYRHHAREVWRDGRFVSFESETSNNGHPQHASATRTAEGVAITGTDGKVLSAPADTHPFSHWNLAALKGPLFNPQTGVMVHEHVVIEPDQTVRLADGRSIAAVRYTVTGDANITDFYDAAGAWAGLHAKTPLDGSLIDYRRL